MAQVRQILKHVRVENSRGRRACRRNRAHLIQRAEPCLVIRDDGAPFTRTYCKECALPILKQCADDLRRFRNQLYGNFGVSAVLEAHKKEAAEPQQLSTGTDP